MIQVFIFILIEEYKNGNKIRYNDFLNSDTKKYEKKYLKLKTIKDALRDALQGSKYRYKVENRDKYAVLEGKHHMIKLSDAIDIAVRNGTIYPRKDFVVV